MGDDVRLRARTGLWRVVGTQTLREILTDLDEIKAGEILAKAKQHFGHAWGAYFEIQIEPASGGPSEVVPGNWIA